MLFILIKLFTLLFVSIKYIQLKKYIWNIIEFIQQFETVGYHILIFYILQ